MVLPTTAAAPTKSTGVSATSILDGGESPGTLGGELPGLVERLKIQDSELSPYSPINSVTGQHMTSIEDEQTVNTALISLLAAITIHDTRVKRDWCLSRKAFFVSDQTKNDHRIFGARVDGLLCHRDTLEVKAIAVVKPFLRHKDKAGHIRVQETGKMAAWICSSPPSNMKELRAKKKKTTRLLVSQDRHEIYLTFATFGADYVDYITGKRFNEAEAFISMKEVGPYSTDHPEHMRNLAVLISAFARQECS